MIACMNIFIFQCCIFYFLGHIDLYTEVQEGTRIPPGPQMRKRMNDLRNQLYYFEVIN